MKNIRIIVVSALLYSAVLLVATFCGTSPITAFADTTVSCNYDAAEMPLSFQNQIEEMFEKDIESITYLYNFDDIADYFYVDFADSGYAVFNKTTLELLEC